MRPSGSAAGRAAAEAHARSAARGERRLSQGGAGGNRSAEQGEARRHRRHEAVEGLARGRAAVDRVRRSVRAVLPGSRQVAGSEPTLVRADRSGRESQAAQGDGHAVRRRFAAAAYRREGVCGRGCGQRGHRQSRRGGHAMTKGKGTGDDVVELEAMDVAEWEGQQFTPRADEKMVELDKETARATKPPATQSAPTPTPARTTTQTVRRVTPASQPVVSPTPAAP